MVKRAPIALLKAGTVHPGHYLVLVGGTVAGVEEAWRTGSGAGDVTDDVFLPDPHHDGAAPSATAPIRDEALGILETRRRRPPAARRRRLKAAVHLATLRLADDLGGAGFRPDGRSPRSRPRWRSLRAPPAKGQILHQALLSRLETTVLDVVAEGTRYAGCRYESRTAPRSEGGGVTMHLGSVIGTLVPAVIADGMEGVPLLWVQPLDKQGRRRRAFVAPTAPAWPVPARRSTGRPVARRR